MDRLEEQGIRRPDLDDHTEVHHGDPVRHVVHHAEVVRDEDVRQLEVVLEVVEEVDHLCLDRNVERGHRLVGDDQLRAQRERAGDSDPLPLPTGELVGVAVHMLRGEADDLEQLLHALPDLL